jgi:hypothetical protein
LQHALAQSAPHFLASAFLAQPSQAFSAVHAVQSFLAVHAVQSAFLLSAFLALHPQVSHAKADDPATNSAITAMLIILFMVDLLLLVNQLVLRPT